MKLDNQDKGYAWVVLAASFTLSTLSSWHATMYGVLYPELVDYFRVSKADVAVIGSLGTGFSGLIGIVLGPLIRRFGARIVVMFGSLVMSVGLALSSARFNMRALNFLLGVLPGIGSGCYMIGSMFALLEYFDRRRSLAFGLQALGMSVGVTLSPFLTNLLIKSYGWMGCLLVISGVQLNGIACGALLLPFKRAQINESQPNPDESKNKCLRHLKTFFDYTLLTKRSLALYYLTTMVILSGHCIPYLFLPYRAMSLGIERTKAAFLVSLIGITSGITRPGFGYLGDILGKYRALQMAVSTCLEAGLMIASYFFSSFTSLACYSAFTGAINAGYVSLLGPLLGDVAPPGRLADASGIHMFVAGVKTLISVPIAGYLVDSSGSFGVPFLVFGVVHIFGALLAVSVYFSHRNNFDRREVTSQVDKSTTIYASAVSLTV